MFEFLQKQQKNMLRRIAVNFSDKKCILINSGVKHRRCYTVKSSVPVDHKRPMTVLGIETSCDDTGCAIVDSNSQILGESSRSQIEFHNKYGGINPPMAAEFHRQHIECVVNETLCRANLTVTDLDAIAVTSRPGILMSLTIGLRYAKHLARKYKKPLIPIHHMEAHALMARLEYPHDLQFPFLCLLASGGHCLLAFVRNVTDFCLLGEAIDGAPGESFDKIARTMGLLNLPQYRGKSGGYAIESEAKNSTNPNRFEFSSPLSDSRCCQFSFSGLKTAAIRIITEQSTNKSFDSGNHLMRYHADLCAGILKATTTHIMRKTQRAIQYCERKGFFGVGPDAQPRSLVFSGGVACNDFIYGALGEMSSQFGYRIFRPSKQRCTDNGVMIAWNGIERWQYNSTDYKNLNIDAVRPDTRESFKTNLIDDVLKKNIQCSWTKAPSIQSNAF